MKVSGAGLDPHKHLGKSLKEMRMTLKQLNKKYGLDLCGEGYNSYIVIINNNYNDNNNLVFCWY